MPTRRGLPRPPATHLAPRPFSRPPPPPPPCTTQAQTSRLCELILLPARLGSAWLQRTVELERCLGAVASSHPNPHHATAQPQSTVGGAYASAHEAFEHALASRPSGGAVPDAPAKCFGRQTVIATVTLLRRLLREAAWPRDLAATHAVETQLANVAVQMILEPLRPPAAPTPSAPQ